MGSGDLIRVGLPAGPTHHSPVRPCPRIHASMYAPFSHSNVLYSDLKPDNILLDAQGHAHITDFNVAIHYSERRLHTSVAGSMAYMAPEILARQGYTWPVDWWSLGVVLWELIFHRRPFDGRNADRMTQAIINDALRYPQTLSEYCTEEAKDFISGVSVVSRSARAVPVSDILPHSCWRRTQNFGWVAAAEVGESTTSMIILGLQGWTGMPWITKRFSQHLLPM